MCFGLFAALLQALVLFLGCHQVLREIEDTLPQMPMFTGLALVRAEIQSHLSSETNGTTVAFNVVTTLTTPVTMVGSLSLLAGMLQTTRLWDL
jgi:hypothetical protein